MALRRIFTEFCDNSSIHGIRYISERRRHWSERLWWIVASSLSLYFCSSSIFNVWMKWYEKPVTLSFTQMDEPISSVPFPTITLCPQTKNYRRKLDLSKAYFIWMDEPKNLSDIEISRIETLYHICPELYSTQLSDTIKFTDNSIYDIMKDMAISVDDIMLRCQWREVEYNCSEFFQPIFTDDGLCFAFNALNSHEMYTDNMASELMTVKKNSNISNWSLEDGYKKNSPKKDYPNRIFNAKQFAGFVITLQLPYDDIEYLCTGLIEGFKLTLTMPGEIRKSTTYFFQVLLSEQAEIFIKPEMITTSKKLRRYTPYQRRCFFDSDRQLRFFKFYSQSNCESECVANFTNMECGCVKFSMPRDKYTRICGIGRVKCYRDAEKKLFGEDVIDEFANDTVKLYRERCNCLPACTSITYEAYIDRTKFDIKRVLKSLGLFNSNSSNYQLASLSVFFGDTDVTTLKRSESHTYTDFFANCGGLLGLFLGVSVLSIIEFVYYSTLRLYWNIRRSRAETAVALFERRPISCITIDSFNSRKCE